MATQPQRIQEREVHARFYAVDNGEPPMFALVDGTVYRREEDQEIALAKLKDDELTEAFRDDFGEEAHRRLCEILDFQNHLQVLEEDQIEKRLVHALPNHKAVIEWGVCPENAPLDAIEWARHSRCMLPPA